MGHKLPILMPSQEEWKILHRRLTRQEAGATETLYGYVQELCRRQPSGQGRDDLVQELMHCVVRQLLDESRVHHLLRIHDLRAFLSAMVNNLARRLTRSERTALSLEALAHEELIADGRGTAPDAATLRHDLQGRVRACLDDLPSADREVLTLRWGDELTSRQIAAVINDRHGGRVSRDAVDARLRRALIRLRALLIRRRILPRAAEE